MSDEHNIHVEGGPTLFDDLTRQEQGDAGLDPWAEILDLINEIKQDADRAGIYTLLPTEVLARRAELYYQQRVDKIRRTLTNGGAAPDVVRAVCHDYITVLTGQFRFKASPKQMQDALRAITPAAAFSIDRYGFYFGLLTNYSRYLLRYHDYVEAVKSEAATDETKRAYLSGHFSAMDARAVRWLLNIGVFQPSDFAGFDPSVMTEFFGRIGGWAVLGEYTLYYLIAKTALLATPQELAEIEAPPIPSQEPVEKFAATVCSETEDFLERAATTFTEAATSEPSPQKEQATEAAREWDDDTNTDTVKIHQNYGLVLSRPVDVSPNGAQITKTFPIQRYIDEFNQKPVRFGNITTFGTVTEQHVQRVFEGANLLPEYFKSRMTVENGRYSFQTNLSEFAEICGYADAGQAEKSALLGALLILRNLFFVLNKPYRTTEYVDSKGRKRTRQVGGLSAVQFLNVREIGMETGDLFIEIYPESLKGKPTLINPKTYKQLRSTAKSTRQSRFNYQIATKSHKSENDLIDDVFGLKQMRDNAATDEEQKRVKTYIQNHRAEFRKKVLAWFKEYVEAGILTTFKREPSKTDKRDFVLSWACPEPEKLIPPDLKPDDLIQDDADEQ